MTVDPQKLLDSFLSGIESSIRSLIIENGSFSYYEFGQSLSRLKKPNSHAVIILSGGARLLCTDGIDWLEGSKLKSGDWVGLASFLSETNCEEVIASSDLITFNFPWSILTDCLHNNSFFEKFCSVCLPAERVNFLVNLWNSEFAHKIELKRFLSIYSDAVTLVNPTTNLDSQQLRYFLCTKEISGDFAYCSELEVGNINKLLSDFPVARILSLEPFDNSDLSKDTQSTPLPRDEVKRLNSREKDSKSFQITSNLFQSISKKIDKNLEDPIDICIVLIDALAEIHNIRFSRDAILNILRDAINRRDVIDLSVLRAACEFHGLQVTPGVISSRTISRIETPSIIEWKDSFALIYHCTADIAYILSPIYGFFELNSQESEESLDKEIVFLNVERTDASPTKTFGVRWVTPFLSKYKSSLLIVLVASLVAQILGLIGPLLVQVIIDKVINQRSIDTLQVLGISLVVVTILEGLLGTLRTILFTQTTNKIDLQIGTRVIDRLLRLPVSYFDVRPVGELSSRLSELEKIRSFLTGQLLTTTLDAFLSLVYIVAMVIYSIPLTLVALSVVPLQIAITLLGAPIFRLQYRDAAQKNAKTQSHLVEVLTGIQTVKSQNIESIARSKWQEFYSKYISSSFNRVIFETSLSESTQTLQKLSQLFVLWVGSTLVLEGKITLGQLIAFRIISGYVTQPLLRLSSLWQSIQELRVSFERLGDIVDTPQENDISKAASKISIPPIQGNLDFKGVSYKFPNSNKSTLSDITLSIPSGLFVGVVGKSGSGKSTLAKLVARLAVPESGAIIMDDYDINKVELYSYRRQIGVVPQEPLLFNGTIFDNIVLGNPNASSEEVIHVSKIACAHEFIMASDEGYSTNVGERGLSLSGGQRQRIALARTLLGKPRFLILDEATSALDYFTENMVFKNLKQSLTGSTVIFITHRLSTMPLADKVIMMDAGHLSEYGTHVDLMRNRQAYYNLYTNKEML